MKRILFFFSFFCFNISAFAQGQINFNNLNALTDPAGYGFYFGTIPVGQLGGGMTAQLFLVNGSVLTALLPTTTFFTDPGAEFLLQPVDITVAGVEPGTTADFVMQAWDSAFNSYAAADAANRLRGQSVVFSNKVGGGTLPPENTVFPGFALIPEPSTIALGLLGAGALLLRRRK
jgi:hypothetical protein